MTVSTVLITDGKVRLESTQVDPKCLKGLVTRVSRRQRKGRGPRDSVVSSARVKETVSNLTYLYVMFVLGVRSHDSFLYSKMCSREIFFFSTWTELTFYRITGLLFSSKS